MLSKFSVKKPFTVLVAIVLVLILGGVSATRMSVDLIPSINLPYAILITSYYGASPEQVEMVVTSTFEQSMASISNIKNISSISQENSSILILEFNDDANMDSAIIEMRESLDMITSYLPDEVGSPIILKLNPDMMPIASISADISGMSTEEASVYINDKIVPEIKSVEGVASVTVTGLIENMVDITLSESKIQDVNKELNALFTKQAEDEVRNAVAEQMQIELNSVFDAQKDLLLAQGLTSEMADTALQTAKDAAQEQMDLELDAIVAEQMSAIEIPAIDFTKDMIKGILQGQNFSMPAGSVASDDLESYLVRVGDKVTSVDELKSLVIINVDDDNKVTFEDVANITVYNNSDLLYSRVNSNHAIALMIQKQPDYTTADVSHKLQDKIAELELDHDGLNFTTFMDQGEYVDLMIVSIFNNLMVGALLAVVILLIFLGKIKPTIIVGASIIISVITAFVLMYFANVSLNMISMGGLALGIGMLVDNSIVVIENIFRLRSEGRTSKEAAIEGAREVASAITASTLTTVIVFLPIAFTTGITKQLFTDMALTITFSLVASLLVALTLVPCACSGMLKNNFTQKTNFTDKLANSYSVLLGKSLKYKWITITICIALLATSILAALSSGTQLFPNMDSGSITISVSMPDEYTQEDSYEALDLLDETLRTISDIDTVAIIANSGDDAMSSMMGSGTTIYVLLKEDPALTTDEVIEEIRTKTDNFEFTVSASNSNMDLSVLSGGQISINVFGRDLDELRETAIDITNKISAIDGATELNNGLGDVQKELRVIVDKDKAIAEGLTVAQVYMTVAGSLAVERSSISITEDGIDYAINVKDDRDATFTDDDIENIEIANQNGEMISISDIAEIYYDEGFSTITRSGQERYVSITGSVRQDYNVSDVNAEIADMLDTYNFPTGSRAVITGETEAIEEAFTDIFLMMALAVVFIYLVMVAQFQSLLSPFIVMFTIPLAFTGGFLALFITGLPVSMVSLIGLVVLVGVVVNNGIVFVDYTNQQILAGSTVHDALITTGKHRLRPILMTALTTIMALVVMALDQSGGGEMLQPMAVTTIGGLVYSTILTLFLVPAMYEITHKKNSRKI